MAHYKFLTLALLLASGSSYAGYAQLAPPVGWSQGGGAASTFNFSKVAANDASFVFNTVRTNASLNVGGRAVTMPAAMRFAANAGRVGAAAAFGAPAVFAALTVGMIGYEAYQFYKDSDFEVKDGVWQKKIISEGVICPSDCYEFNSSFVGPDWYASNSKLIAAYVAKYASLDTYWTISNPHCSDFRTATCSYDYTKPGWSVNNQPVTFQRRSIPPTPTFETRYDKISKQQFEDEMANKPFPNGVPEHFPTPVEWPVEPVPVLNPTPAPSPAPAGQPSPVWSPAPQPLRVPQGEPQPVPNSNPPQWKSPVVDVVPANNPSSPWRVDVQPKDITKADSTPVNQPTPTPDPSAPPDAASEKTPGLCDLYPDILACAKPEFNTPDLPDLDTKNKDITVSAQSGWGASSAACPAPRHLNGAGVEFSFQPMCDGLNMFRPVLLAIAWLSAGLILLGLKGGD